MPINANYEYINAEKKFLSAKNDEEKLQFLEEMLKTMPKHKGTETLGSQLKIRRKKLQEKIRGEKKKKSSSKKSSIKKGEMQAVLIGFTNSGKSSLLSCLTNAKPEIADYEYTTKEVIIGTMDYSGAKIQIVDIPAIENELCDLGVINTADTLLLVIESPSQIPLLENKIRGTIGNRLVVLNKIDRLSELEKRKVNSYLQSKRYNFVLFSCKTLENLELLKKKIFESFGKIRVYTREPGKPKDYDPVILEKGSTVKDIAEKIFHGLSSHIKEARITGPSSKFPNQKVGLTHVLKDLDVVEFSTS